MRPAIQRVLQILALPCLVVGLQSLDVRQVDGPWQHDDQPLPANGPPSGADANPFQQTDNGREENVQENVDEKAQEGATATGKPKLDRIMAMQLSIGCSGSTYVHLTLKQLLEAHDYFVWTPVKEFLQNDKAFHKILKQKKHSPKGIYCTEADGTEHTWAADSVGRLEGAWSVLNGSLACTETNVQQMLKSNVVFLFDGHSVEHMTQAVPFFSRLGPQHAKIYGSRRSNALERFICHVKDCRYMTKQFPSFPVFGANGSKEDSACFTRRQASPEDQPKVYLDAHDLHEYLEDEGQAPWEQEPLRAALAASGFTNYAQFSVEELSEYEYSNDQDAMDSSVDRFMVMLQAVGVKNPSRQIVKSVLGKSQGTRTHYPVEDEIYNFADVSGTLGQYLRKSS